MNRKAVCLLFFGCASFTLIARADTFEPPDGFVFDAAHQHPSDIVEVMDGASVSMVSGGDIGSYLELFDTTVFNMSGGTEGSYVNATNSSIFTITGGTVQSYIESQNSSVVNIYGGSFTGLDEAFGGTINIYGYNLQRTGNTITGTLSDGEAIDVSFTHTLGAQGQLNLIAVPEPTSLTLFTLGISVVGFASWRRRRSG